MCDQSQCNWMAVIGCWMLLAPTSYSSLLVVQLVLNLTQMQFGMISDPTVTSTTVPECHFRRIVLKDSESLYKSLQGDVCEQASAVQRQEYRSPDSPQQEKSAWQARWNWNNQMADCFSSEIFWTFLESYGFSSNLLDFYSLTGSCIKLGPCAKQFEQATIW